MNLALALQVHFHKTQEFEEKTSVH